MKLPQTIVRPADVLGTPSKPSLPTSSVEGRWLFRIGVLAIFLGFLVQPGCQCDTSLGQIFPQLLVSPELIERDVGVSTNELFFITVKNPGNTSLTIDDVAVGGDVGFELVSWPEKVDALSQEDIVVSVRPRVVGTLEADVFVYGEDQAQPNFGQSKIRVNAIDQGLPGITVDPEAIDFARIGQGDVVQETVTIGNQGIRDLIIDDTIFLPNDPEDNAIRLVGAIQSGWILPPGESVSFRLVFAPTDTAVHRGLIRISSNDPDQGVFDIPVNGQGSQCPVAVAELLEDPDQIEPRDTIRFDGHGSYTESQDTTLAQYEWTLEVRPPGSTAVLDRPDFERTQLVTDIAGDYQVRLRVYDDTGVRSCNDAIIRVTAKPTEDLHIQLVWDHPTADLDLHLLKEGGEIFTHEGDCYFSNRHPEDWFPLLPESNPSLDADDNRGYGPENVNVQTPAPGSIWTVAVHYWNKQTDGDPFTIATLRIYARGQIVADIPQSFEDDQSLWTAVEIAWSEDPNELPQVTQIGQVLPFPRPF